MEIKKAFALSAGSRFISVVSGLVTPELISRNLSATEQGVYYTILSMLALQIIMELGVGNFIVVKASHLTAHKQFEKRTEENYSGELSALFRGSVKWYAAAAVGLCAVVGFMYPFFLGKVDGVDSTGALVAVLFFAGLNTCLMPFILTIEGAGHVVDAAKCRLTQAIVGSALAWAALVMGFGLYSLAAMSLGQALGGLAALRSWIPSLARLYKQRSGAVFSWRSTMWPLQKRASFEVIGLYVLNSMTTLIIMRVAGPVAAGEWGMTMRVFDVIILFAGALISLRAPQFGKLYKQGLFQDLKSIWKKSYIQSCLLCLVIAVSVIGCLRVLDILGFHFPQRMCSIEVQWLLVSLAVMRCVIWGLDILVKSSFVEPFAVLNLSKVVVTTLLLLLIVPVYGVAGAAWILLGVTTLFVLPWVIWITSKTVAKWNEDCA